ncbi:MAG: hypothetical protein HXY24_07220 [Rubrivivax sp.]|nr:hypothetical protein [Rubrivivax sp.]
MTLPGSPNRPPPPERLRFLAETVAAEAELLAITDDRLFSQPMTVERAATLLIRHEYVFKPHSARRGPGSRPARAAGWPR